MNPGFNVMLATLVLRTVAGILFFFQGYDKLFNIRIAGIINTFGDSFFRKKIPAAALRPAILISSWIELICGLALFIGLERNIALYLLSFNMIFVALAFSIIKPM